MKVFVLFLEVGEGSNIVDKKKTLCMLTEN